MIRSKTIDERKHSCTGRNAGTIRYVGTLVQDMKIEQDKWIMSENDRQSILWGDL